VQRSTGLVDLEARIKMMILSSIYKHSRHFSLRLQHPLCYLLIREYLITAREYFQLRSARNKQSKMKF